MPECSKIKNQGVQKSSRFSYKVSYQDLFWLFMLGSAAGFVIEGIWCILKKGTWESHSATLWGPFCIIYGLGAVLDYLTTLVLRKQNYIIQFVVFSFGGAAIEYFSSLFQEYFLGSTSWNYSRHFLNVSGRVSLQMAFVWGVLGILFVRLIFPLLNHLFSKMRTKYWNVLCILATVFMLANLIVSAAAVIRWRNRLDHEPAANRIEQILDDAYDNDTMERLYSNMKFSTEASQ